MKDDRLEVVADVLMSALVSVGILPDADEQVWPRPCGDDGGDDEGAFCLVSVDDGPTSTAVC